MKKYNGKYIIEEVLNHVELKAPTFAENIGVAYSRIFDIQREKTKKISGDLANTIITKYPQFNLEWLLTGEGNMLKSDEITDFKDYRLVPVYNLDVVGGVNNSVVDTSEYIVDHIPFKNAREDDISVHVTNNSMYPIYPPGCFIQIRKIEDWRDYLEYGQVYVIELNDGRRLLKQIRKNRDKNCFTFISFNEEYDETEIRINFIRSIWLVLAKYQKSVM